MGVEACSRGNLEHSRPRGAWGTSSVFSLPPSVPDGPMFVPVVLRHRISLLADLPCVPESMLYLDGQRHFNSMRASETLNKDYLLKPQGKPRLLETSVPQ